MCHGSYTPVGVCAVSVKLGPLPEARRTCRTCRKLTGLAEAHKTRCDPQVVDQTPRRLLPSSTPVRTARVSQPGYASWTTPRECSCCVPRLAQCWGSVAQSRCLGASVPRCLDVSMSRYLGAYASVPRWRLGGSLPAPQVVSQLRYYTDCYQILLCTRVPGASNLRYQGVRAPACHVSQVLNWCTQIDSL